MVDTDNTPRNRYEVTINGKTTEPADVKPADIEPLEGQITIKGFKITHDVQKAIGTQAPTKGPLKEISEQVNEMTKGVKEALDTEAYRAIRRAFEKIAAEIQELKESYPEVQALAPFLAIELEEAQQKGQYPGITLTELIDKAFYTDGTPRDGEYLSLVEKAREQLPRIMAVPSDKMPLPLDMVNRLIWTGLEQLANGGEVSFDTTKGKDRKKGVETIVGFAIDFSTLETPDSGVTITRQLTPFDKRCYLAIAALYNAGNEVMSATQIYKMMGYRGSPAAEHIQRINDSLSKMGAARVHVDNTNEADTYKGYPVFKYDASLLPFERISAYINNQICESAIRLFREPPLITFARKRSQITTIPKQLLETPGSKTDTSFRLEDYFLTQISFMKGNKKFSRKMLFSSIYEKCQITTKKQRQRSPEQIRKILTYYMEQGYITGFIEDKDGIIIRF